MDMTLLLNKIFVFFVLMLIGYGFARKGVAGPEFTTAATKLLMNVFLPAAVLNSVVANPPQLSGGELWEVLLVTTAAIAVPYFLALIAVKLLPFEKSKKPVLEMLMATCNTMFVALPVVQALFGAEAVFYVAMSNIPFNVMIFSFGVWRINGGGKSSIRFKDMFSAALISTFAALVIFLVKIPVPTVFKDMASTMSAVTMPLSMLIIGSSLGRQSLEKTFTEKRIYAVSFFRLLVFPLLLWPLICLLTANPVLRGTGMIITGCPSAALVTIFSIQYGRDYELSSKGILMSTALSMATLPLLCYILL